MVQTFGAQLGYIIVIGQTLTELLQGWGCSNLVCDQYFTTVFSTVFLVSPICLFRHFGHLAWLSIFSICAIVLCIGLVVIAGPIKTANDTKDSIVWYDPVGSLQSIGSIVFALSCSPANFQAYVSTDRKSQNLDTWSYVTGGAVFLGSGMCVLMGVCK